jgi:GNAT superfamily N-acetyltransferase
MSWTVRPAEEDDADLAAIADVVNRTVPEAPTSVEEMRWTTATYGPPARFVAESDGDVVGAATAGRIFMRPSSFDGWWGTIAVLADRRRQGIGGALLRAMSGPARQAGKSAFHITVGEHRPEGIDFLTHRGFVEYQRGKAVALDLRGRTVAEADPPGGIEIATLAARPDLVDGVHAVARATFPDIPGGDEPIDPGSLDEFRARDVDRPSIPKEGFPVAVDTATGEVVGYASLVFLPGSSTRAYHDMTAVLPAWRGRGLARVLKQATIAWAIANGLDVLETGNDEGNAAMRAVNARLGYAPLPDQIEYRGPLAPEAT